MALNLLFLLFLLLLVSYSLVARPYSSTHTNGFSSPTKKTFLHPHILQSKTSTRKSKKLQASPPAHLLTHLPKKPPILVLYIFYRKRVSVYLAADTAVATPRHLQHHCVLFYRGYTPVHVSHPTQQSRHSAFVPKDGLPLRAAVGLPGLSETMPAASAAVSPLPRMHSSSKILASSSLPLLMSFSNSSYSVNATSQ